MRSILVIGAHPADCVDLAGGTIYEHVSGGDTVRLMTLTDGLWSHTAHGESLAVKREEFKAAAAVLGISEFDCYFMGLQDEPLDVNRDVIRDLALMIRSLKPDTVITHHPNEYAHWDHHECGEAVCRALKAAIKLPSPYPESVPHFVPSLYFFAVQFRPEVARVGAVPQAPDVLVELPYDAVKAKVKAMMCFASQGHNDESKMWMRMNSMESEMGRADGLQYSEGFILGQPLKVQALPGNMETSFYKLVKKGGGE